MSGQFLRKPAEVQHQCDPPNAPVGSVWQCDCGKRWTCTDDTAKTGHLSPGSVKRWVRRYRYWPWPRAATTTKLGTLRMPDGYVPPSGSLSPPKPTTPSPGGSGVTPPAEHHCPRCRCGTGAALTRDPREVEVVTDGNPAAYLYNAQ